MMSDEPTCPECGSKVGRPKCFLELGAACPRHEIYHEWQESQKPRMSEGEISTAIAFAKLELAEVEIGHRELRHCPGIQALADEGRRDD